MLNYDVGAKSYWHQYDCNPYSEDGKLTSSNKYTIREWSHDRFHSELVHNYPILDPHGDEILGPSESNTLCPVILPLFSTTNSPNAIIISGIKT
jgi:hypothetical protein